MEIEKNQKREFYRIERVLPIEFEIKKNGVVIKEFGETFNISGKGVAFDGNLLLKDKEDIKIIITIEDKKIETLATIIAISEHDENISKYKYRYRVMFKNIKKKMQNIILDYVWKEQLKKDTAK